MVYDVEVSYRPKGCITFTGGTKYDGWTAVVLNRAPDGTLLDDQGNPLPEGHPFENVRPSLYWSSTTVPSEPNQARFVFIGIGPSVWDHKSVLLGVWPVRGGLEENK